MCRSSPSTRVAGPGGIKGGGAGGSGISCSCGDVVGAAGGNAGRAGHQSSTAGSVGAGGAGTTSAAPSHGTATVTTSGITYTPASGYASPDSFTDEVVNTIGTGYVTLTATVTVDEPPQRPRPARSRSAQQRSRRWRRTWAPEGLVGEGTDA